MGRSRSLSEPHKEKLRRRCSEVIAPSSSDLKSSDDEVRGSRSLSCVLTRVRLRTPKPNKAPEPTTFAVTSRATVRLLEMNQRNPNRNAARAAPAKVVAHL